MTIPHLSLAIAGGLILAGGAAWCLFATLRYERPAWTAPLLTVAFWWLGQLLAWAIVATLAGGLFGVTARAAWMMVNGQ